VREFLAPTNSLLLLLLLTFATYGTHLPGDPRGSFDHVREGNRRALPPSPSLHRFSHDLLRHPPFLLTTPRARNLVRDAIVESSAFRAWSLLAVHVRTNHLHAVVDMEVKPGDVFSTWKAYATRALRNAGEAATDQKVWAHGGSAQRLRTTGLAGAIRYVLTRQGEPMATYCADRR
jgi:hypothetical protein